MLTTLIETSGGLTVGNALLLVLCAAGCGLLIAFTAALFPDCGKGFAVSLAVLPVVVQAVILMVNGNLGAGVAVVGAFSLIRFRSIPGTFRDITLIFLAMAAGLATGMAYATYAFLITVIACGLLLLLDRLGSARRWQTKRLRVTIPEDLDYTGVFDDLFAQYAARHSLECVKTTNMGSMFELRYRIVIKEPQREKEFLDALRCRNGNLTVALTQSGVGQEE